MFPLGAVHKNARDSIMGAIHDHLQSGSVTKQLSSALEKCLATTSGGIDC
jgi:hypothetical protein